MKKKFWNRFGSRGERAKNVRESRIRAAPGRPPYGIARAAPGLQIWLYVMIWDSRTFFARSPRLPNRFQNFFFHMKAFLLKIPNLLEGIRSFLFMELLGRVEVSISVNKCRKMQKIVPEPKCEPKKMTWWLAFLAIGLGWLLWWY